MAKESPKQASGYQKTSWPWIVYDPASGADATAMALIKDGKKLLGVFPKEVTQVGEEKMVVKLSEATKMYQEVAGSDSGSRYLVVALGAKAHVAARWVHGQLSIRVERPELGGPLPPDVVTACKNVGMKVSNSHASIHMSVPEQVLAAKSLGSMLVGLGFQFITPAPVFSSLVGKGA